MLVTKTLSFKDGLRDMNIEDVIKEFDPLLKKYASKYKSFMSMDEANQLVRITLWKAFDKYKLILNEHNNTYLSFPYYVETAVRNKFNEVYRTYKSKETHMPMTYIMDIDVYEIDAVGAKSDNYNFIFDEDFYQIYNDITKKDKMIHDAILMLLQGYSYKETADKLDTSVNVMNAKISRFRKRNRSIRQVILSKYKL